MKNNQSRPGSTLLVGMVIAASVGLGVVGCAEHPTTPSASSMSGTISTSAPSRALVDVAAVWATHPLPDCPKAPIGRNGGVVPSGLELPTESTVSEILGDVKSPAPEPWVKMKLGWVTRWLLKTRADIVDANTPGDTLMLDGFKQYVGHVRSELEAGQNSSDEALDGDYPDGCA